MDGPAEGGNDGPARYGEGIGGGRMGCNAGADGGRAGRVKLGGEVSGEEERLTRLAGVGFIATSHQIYISTRDL